MVFESIAFEMLAIPNLSKKLGLVPTDNFHESGKFDARIPVISRAQSPITISPLWELRIRLVNGAHFIID